LSMSATTSDKELTIEEKGHCSRRGITIEEKAEFCAILWGPPHELNLLPCRKKMIVEKPSASGNFA
jgi:hypothetical protein